MIKTLRITSVLVVVLAAGFVIFPVVFGARTDKQTAQLLSLPSVVDQFRKAAGARGKSRQDQTSPLVKQAQAFASYLSPPKPKKPKKPLRPATGKKARPEPKGPVSAKFNLVATCVYPSRPEQSVALIDEPGGGLHWVRQSSKVKHLTIEQVKDGCIVVKDAKGTHELVAERQPKVNLLKGASPGPAVPKPPSPPPAKTPPAAATQVSPNEKAALADEIFTQVEAMMKSGAKPEEADSNKHPEASALLERLVTNLAAMQSGQKPGEKSDAEPDAEENKRPAISPEAPRVGLDEAKRLGRLGKELRVNEQDPNRPTSSKVQKSKRPPAKRRRPIPRRRRRTDRPSDR